jgi:hypothetical protein
MGVVRDWDSKTGIPRKRERETFVSSKASLSHS